MFLSIIDDITDAVSRVVESALGVSLLDMFIQLAATVLLVIIVKKFLWSKVTDFLEKRRQLLASEVDQADAAKAAAIELEKDRQAQIAALERQKTEVLLEAHKLGQAEREAIVEAARVEADRINQETQRQLDYDIQKARETLSAEVVDLAAAIAKKMIEAEIDPSRYTEEAVKAVVKKEA